MNRQTLLVIGTGVAAVLVGFGVGALFIDSPPPPPPTTRLPVTPPPLIATAPDPVDPPRLEVIYEETLPEDAYLPETSSLVAPVPPKSIDDLIDRVEHESEPPPAWIKNAVAAADPGALKMIAVVIDDLGVDQQRSRLILELPAPLTTAFLPYAEDIRAQTDFARRRGHELMVHMSMEPGSRAVDPGPRVLKVGDDDATLRANIDWALSRFDGFVGTNNHMGSRFTAHGPGMAVVMDALRARGLLFLDSRTTAKTTGPAQATAHGIPYAERNVFLDNENEVAAVNKQLAILEETARTRGQAIGIGHPRDATIVALADWMPTLVEKGFVLVPVSAIVRARYDVEWPVLAQRGTK